MLNAMGYVVYARPDSTPASVKDAVSVSPSVSVKVFTDSALSRAIVKAAQGRDVSQLAIDVDALRFSPQAKRALWSQLRRVIKS